MQKQSAFLSTLFEYAKRHFGIAIAVCSAISASIAIYISNESNRIAYQNLLISTFEQYNKFYNQVSDDPTRYCIGDTLAANYLAQLNSMLPLVGKDIKAPYDNPCPSPSPPEAPSLIVQIINKWETVEELESDPEASCIFTIGEVNYPVPLGDSVKTQLVKWVKDSEATKASEVKTTP